MKISFLDKSINIKDSVKEGNFNSCLLENNEKQIGEICNFLQNNKKLFLLNGFIGTGKTSIVNFVMQNLKTNVIAINYTCFETTILDDMLLSFFESFRNYTIQGKISPPRLKVENFTQKINLYFNYIKKPILIVLNSFDNVLKENKDEILSFIKHISALKNVKIIIISRASCCGDFEDLEYDKSSTLALSKEIFEKFLKENEIKNIGILSNELYNQTKGYFLQVDLSVRLMRLRSLNISKFLELYSKSLMTFPDFIYREMLTFVDPVSLHLFRLLAIMRIPIHINLLKSLHLYNPNQIMFFVQNSVLASEGESIYLPDYYREIIEHQIQDNVMIKLHKSCIQLYEAQLPLKPMERDLRLSRQTMRNEIDYHNLFVPQRPKIQPIVDLRIPGTFIKKEEPVEEQVSVVQDDDKEEKIENINFIIEDGAVLDDIAGSIKDFVSDKAQINELVLKSSNSTLTELMNEAKQAENEYHYKNASILYQKALTKKDDENFDKFLPTIYIRLAEVYKRSSQWYEALEYYTKAQDFYYNVSNYDMANDIKLKIANIYFVIYKHDNARYILKELEKDKNIKNELRIKVNIALAKLSDNINEQYSYYQRSLTLVDSFTEKKISAELYYRYAGLSDEKEDTETAVIYYKKSIEAEPDPKKNKYIAKAYASLANLYDEDGKSDLAIKYYKKSLETDSLTKNYNGLYAGSRHLSELYASRDSQKSLEYLMKAHEYAKKLNEPYYMADIAYEIGNYYLLRKDFEESLKYLEESLEVVKTSFSKEDTERILAKIDYVKKLKE